MAIDTRSVRVVVRTFARIDSEVLPPGPQAALRGYALTSTPVLLGAVALSQRSFAQRLRRTEGIHG